MAADINKIFSKEALDSIDIAIKRMTELELKTDALLKKAMNLNKQLAKANGLQKNTEQTKANNKAKTEAQKIHKQYQNEIKKTEKVYGNMNRAIVRQRTERQKANQIIKLEQQAMNSAKGSYKQLEAQMKLNILKYKEMSAAERQNTKVGKQLTASIKKQHSALKRMDAQMGTHHRNVGNYKSALGGASKALGMFGVMLGGAAIIQGFKKLIGLGAEFEKQMSRVAAVSNATGPQMQMLTQQAKQLGANTEKTAKQVGDLQMELAKLGLVAKEIIAVTGAILDMATASDADLGQAASVAAKTMKGFGLQAKDMNRIVDVMAKAFSSSALDINKFETAMSDVAPTAKAFGESIERSSAKLSILVDNGLDASKAGTSLRNMYLELSKTGLTWNEAMEKIENSTNRNSTALEMFGKRGAVAGLILADNQTRVEMLTGVYERSAGAAKTMADIMRDNLSGSMDKANSALQGLGIGIMDKLNKPVRAVIDSFTRMITVINDSMDASESMIRMAKDESAEIKILFGLLNDENVSRENKQKIMDQINTGYGEYLPNMITEETNVKDLAAAYEILSQQILASAVARQMEKELEDYNNALIEMADAMLESQKAEAAKQEALKHSDFAYGEVTEAANDAADASRAFFASDVGQEIVNNIVDPAEVIREKYKGIAELLKVSWDDVIGIITGGKSEAAAETIATQTRALIELNKLQQKAAPAIGGPELPETLEPRAQWKTDGDYYLEIWEKSYEGRLQALKDMHAKGEISNAEYDAKVKEMKGEAAQEAIDMAAYVAASAFSIHQESLNRQIQSLEIQKEYELGLAEGSKERQQEINEKYARKEAQLRRKKAVADKAAALIQAAMNTAQAIVLATTSAPGPVGIAMAVITAAFNAIQLATIAATPIPQFKKGGKQKKSGAAIVSEIGPELLVGPRGDIELSGSKGAEMRWLEAGTQIIPNAETSKILSAAGKGGDSLVMAQLAGVIQQGDKGIISAIKNIPELTVIPDQRKIIERKGNYFTTYLESKTQ